MTGQYLNEYGVTVNLRGLRYKNLRIYFQDKPYCDYIKCTDYDSSCE